MTKQSIEQPECADKNLNAVTNQSGQQLELCYVVLIYQGSGSWKPSSSCDFTDPKGPSIY